MPKSCINFGMLNWIYKSYQRECIKSPKYFITHFQKPNYCGLGLLINYENMPYIRNGQFIAKAKAQNSPSVDLTSYITVIEPFTLIMNDPDSSFPSGNTVHWVIVNITTTSDKYHDNSLLPGITLQGKQLYGRIILLLIPPEYGGGTLDYIGPGPPINTGFHKYIFSLYNQNAGEIPYYGPIPIEESQEDLFSQLGILPSDLVATLYFVSSYYPI
jgi:phosphatidylethanolamine-binding protein (PEBP) family uncharacterized protein